MAREVNIPVNVKEIKQLIKLMVDNGLTELDIESGTMKVALKRGPGGEPVVAYPAQQEQADRPKAQAGGLPDRQAGGKPKGNSKPTEALLEIKSPMVGTFYTAASPDSEPYVQAGDHIAGDSVVCIIEAMKVMNEIKAECSGTIAEVCVNNAQPVEFGQVLFRVRP